MSYFINETGNYHREELDTLGWELTVCNMIASPGSVCRRFLKKNSSFGDHLYSCLESMIPLSEVCDVLEVGGGYGYLMRDFLVRNPHLRSVMLDISPLLLSKQKDTLRPWSVEFIEEDFFRADNSFLKKFDLALFNENCGDFPTAVNVAGEVVRGKSSGNDGVIEKITRQIKNYTLSVPEEGQFNYNLGAVEAVEKLCSAGIPCIYISEHSCEAETPDYLRGLVDVRSTGNPERISLKGHDEYTIKFSHLARVAECCGYRVHRGQFIDFIMPDINSELRFILTSGSTKTDDHEIIRQFVEDLVKYEFLVLIKNDTLR